MRHLSTWLDARAPLAELSGALDAATPEERVASTAALSRRHQRLLWRLAEDAAPVTADDLVPPTLAPLTPVRHHGVNSLPVPASWRVFRKVMARDTDGAVIGWNDSPLAPWIGPGYFVITGTDAFPDGPRRGGQVVDYYQIPRGAVPAGWPGVVPNWWGLQVFVYHQTRDFLRRVSAHVVIGAAYKWGLPLDQYFVLVREP